MLPAAASRALAAAALALLAPAGRADAPWDGEAFSAEPRALLAAAQALPAPSDEGVDLILEEGDYRLDARGAVTFTHRLVVRPLTADAARSWARVQASWAPWNQARPEIRARVITAQGEAHELDPATLTEQGVGDADEMYSDRRLLAGPLPGVRVGSVIEVSITLRDLAPAFDAGGVLRFHLARTAPVRRVRVAVEAPAALPLRWAVRGAHLAPKEAVKDGVRRLALERSDVPAVEPPERNAPRDVAAVPFLAFGWGRSWAEVAERYGALWERQLAGADLSAAARAALGERTPGRQEAVRRAVAWLHENVRYTGLELGEAALVPAAPAETLRRRYGDCKDLSLLLVGLLRQAGLDARLVLVRTGWEEILPELPGLSQFDHVVVRVEGSPPIWLDATDPYTPPGRLPPSVEGRLALPTGKGVKALERTPESGPEAHHARVVRELHAAEIGEGRIVEIRELTGALAGAERAFRDRVPPSQRDALAERYAKEALRADELVSAAVEGLEDPAAPLRVRIEARGSEAVRTGDDAAELPVTPDQVFDALPAELSGAPEEEGRAPPKAPAPRRADLVLAVPYRWEIIYRVFPPDGFRPRPLPAGSTERFGPARFTQQYALEPDGTVTATFQFDAGGRRLSAADAGALARRLREVRRGRSPVVQLERTAAALLAAGQVPEALAEMRALAARHPLAAVHRLHLAIALARIGFCEEGAAEARRAVALEPGLAWAQRVLAFVLEHDGVGRFHGPGFDREGAIAAYREAKALDPAHPGARAALAELLAHDGAGQVAPPGAGLDEALAELAAIRRDLDEPGFEAERLELLVEAKRFAEAEALARELPRGAARDATLLAAIAAQRPAPAAEEEARGLGEGRREALRGASRLLVRARRYGPAPALAAAAALGAPDAAQIRQQADLFQGLTPWEGLRERGDEADRLVRRLFVSGVVGKEPAKLLGALLARSRIPPDLLDVSEAGLFAPVAGARRAARELGIPPDVLLDLVLSRLEVLKDGDPATGQRIRLHLPVAGGDGTSVIFAVRGERGGLRILATDASWPVLAAEADRAARAGDVAAARRWLDWTREVVPGAPGDDSSPAALLALLWRPGAAGGAAEIRRAAAALLAFADARGRTIPTLVQARDRASGPERRALGFALAQAYRAAERNEDLRAMTAELLAEDPASRPAFFLHALALQRLRDASGLGAAAEAILARLPGDPELLELTANAWLALGDLEGAARAFQRALDAGLARPAVYNNAAWLELFREPPSRAALEWARRAGAPDRADHASLNTLAAVHASFGQPQEAREVFLRSLQVAGEAPPGPADWLVHGLIAEAWGLTEAARASFAKVEPEPQDPTAPYLLARRRLAALSGDSTPALPVAPTAAPPAAPDRAGPAKPAKPVKPHAPRSPSRKRAPQPPPAKTAPA